MIQANATLLATLQRTAATLRAAPTPIIAQVMVWVVRDGKGRQKQRYRPAPPRHRSPVRVNQGNIGPHRVDNTPPTKQCS